MQKGRNRQSNILSFAPYLIALAATAAGVLVGAFSAIKMSGAEVQACAESIKTALAAPQGSSKCFFDALMQNLKSTAVFWILGMTVIGSVPLAALSYHRGYAVGLTVAFLIRQYGLAGLLSAACGVLPHSIIYIPAYIIIAGLGMSFSCRLLSDKKNIKSLFLKYSVRTAALLALICAGSAIEGYFSSWMFSVTLNLAK